MMVKSRSTFALMALMVVGSALAAPDNVALESLAPGAHTQEAARRHAATKDALSLVSKAREAYQAKRYTEAVEHYRNALSVLPKAPATQKLHQFICESLSDALIARAIDYRSVGRREEAMAFLREAVKLAPDNARAKTELIYTQDPVRTNPALTPAHVGDVEEVSRLLSLGYGYMELGKYDEAIKSFEAVSGYDEYNVSAKRGIEKAQQLRARYFSAAHDARRAEMLAEVGKTWEDAMNHSSTPIIVSGAEGSAAAEDGSVAGAEEAAHAESVKQIRVSGFALDDNTIDEAIEVLRNCIKRYESSGALSGGRKMDVRANFGAQESPERREVMARRASIQLDDVSMKDLLDEVSRLYDVDYYYVPYGIEFSFSGKDYGRLMDRVFTVPPHFFDKGDSGSDDDDDDAFATTGRVSVKRENPVKVLTDMGVSFPEGANAIYRASERRLRVRNTVQNLQKIEQLLNAPPPNQWVVVFNVMTVETSDRELQDLGFDWLFNMHLGGDFFAGGGASRAASGIVGMPTISTAVGGTAQPQGSAATSGLRSIRQISGTQGLTRLIEQGSVENYASSLNQAAVSPSIFGIRGVWSAADVTVMMRGLAQNKGTDTLQNERLVFTPGSDEQVSIVNVREMFYPEAYDPPQIPNNRSRNTNNNNNNWDDDDDDDTTNNNTTGPSTTVITGSHPTDFVRFGYSEDGAGGIGGIIQIHKAEPTPDGQSVNLAITTTVNEFDGFIDWGTPIYAGMSTTADAAMATNRIRRVMLSENHIYQPVFKRRMLNTTLSVANGGVIVIGGMLEARLVRYEDKVPVLGDLPLIGRLFRSEGEEKERRALLIFAKVDIVDPTGRSVNGSEIDTSADTPM